MRVYEKCDECDGEGIDPANDDLSCPFCNGTGEIVNDNE